VARVYFLDKSGNKTAYWGETGEYPEELLKELLMRQKPKKSDFVDRPFSMSILEPVKTDKRQQPGSSLYVDKPFAKPTPVMIATG